MKVYIWPLLVSFITIVAGLTLFFFAFCSSFDFRYPIYCDVFDFNGPGRIDQADHKIIEEDLKNCKDHQTYYTMLGWNFIFLLIALGATIILFVIGYVIWFNYKNKPD